MKTPIIEIIICLTIGGFFGWFFSHEAKKPDKYLNMPDAGNWYSGSALDEFTVGKPETETTYKLYKNYPGNIKVYQARWEDGILRIIQ